MRNTRALSLLPISSATLVGCQRIEHLRSTGECMHGHSSKGEGRAHVAQDIDVEQGAGREDEVTLHEVEHFAEEGATRRLAQHRLL